MIAAGRVSEAVDGETMDVSSKGLGVKLGKGNIAKVEALLESLVEDRQPAEVTLRLPEGSVRIEGQVMWWGILGDDREFALRAGILLPNGWSDSNWTLIEKYLTTA